MKSKWNGNWNVVQVEINGVWVILALLWIRMQIISTITDVYFNAWLIMVHLFILTWTLESQLQDNMNIFNYILIPVMAHNTPGENIYHNFPERDIIIIQDHTCFFFCNPENFSLMFQVYMYIFHKLTGIFASNHQ